MLVHIEEAIRAALPGVPLRKNDHGAAYARSLHGVAGSTWAPKLLRSLGRRALASMTAGEMAETAGVPLRVAECVVAARSFGSELRRETPRSIRTVKDAVATLPVGLELVETEVVLAIALTVTSTLIETVLLAKGGGASAALEMRDVFRPLIRIGASCFILAHNHPSGDPSPSQSDVELTNRVAVAGRILALPLLDHLVIGLSGTVSFLETGLLPTVPELNELERDAAEEGGAS